MLQDKDIKKIQELKADFTPGRVSAEDIFSRFKALKLSYVSFSINCTINQSILLQEPVN